MKQADEPRDADETLIWKLVAVSATVMEAAAVVTLRRWPMVIHLPVCDSFDTYDCYDYDLLRLVMLAFLTRLLRPTTTNTYYYYYYYDYYYYYY